MSNGNRGRTEFLTEVVFLGKLVEQVAAGKVRIPRFQRPFVWKQEDLHQLLDSVLRGIPIGSILVWDTEERIETDERIGPVEVGPRPAGMVGLLRMKLSADELVSVQLACTLASPSVRSSTFCATFCTSVSVVARLPSLQ